MTTIYVTKYAFTEGVFTCDAEVKREDFAVYQRFKGGFAQYFHRNEFHLTEESARADFDRRRSAKLKSLEKSMTKIRNAEFKVTQK